MAASRDWGQPRDSRRPCADGSRPSAERSACPRRNWRSGCASSNLRSSRSNNRKRKAPLRWRHCGGWPRRSIALSFMRWCPTSRWRPSSATGRAPSHAGALSRWSTRCCWRTRRGLARRGTPQRGLRKLSARQPHGCFGTSPVSDLFEPPDDAATPLTPEEIRGLIPAHIAYRRELNEAEQDNIARAQEWALSRRRDLLSEKFVKNLHRQMLGLIQ